MANEAVCIETPTIFRRRVIAAAAVLPFGTITKLTDNNTVEASAADNDPFGGIVWERASTATSTHTEITVAMDGTWDIKDTAVGGSAGAIVNIGGANLISDSAAADLLTGSVVGKREMDAAASEVTRIRLVGY